MTKAIELNRDHYIKYVAKRYLEEYLFRNPKSPLLSSVPSHCLTGIRLAIEDCKDINMCFNSTKDLLSLVPKDVLDVTIEELNGAKFQFGDFDDPLFIEYKWRNIIDYWRFVFYGNLEKYQKEIRDSIVVEKSQFVDERDDKEYKSVNINGNIWMAENFDFNGVESICYNGKKDMECSFYGRLYPFYSASKACPTTG